MMRNDRFLLSIPMTVPLSVTWGRSLCVSLAFTFGSVIFWGYCFMKESDILCIFFFFDVCEWPCYSLCTYKILRNDEQNVVWWPREPERGLACRTCHYTWNRHRAPWSAGTGGRWWAWSARAGWGGARPWFREPTVRAPDATRPRGRSGA